VNAVDWRSWSHPAEPTSKNGGPTSWPILARVREKRRASDLPIRRAFYTLADELRQTILVACSKCDWRAAFSRDELIVAHGGGLSAAQPA
jgi:hypothetical protein